MNTTFNKQNILLVIAILLIGYNIFTSNSIKTDVQGYKDKIDSIQTKVDSAQVVNNQIDDKVMEVKENVTNITKDNSIITIGNIELEQLFAARYNQSSTSN